MSDNKVIRPQSRGAKPAKPESPIPLKGKAGQPYSKERIAKRAMEHEQHGQPSHKAGRYRGQGIGEAGLTAKQEHFAILVAQGSTLSDAYRQAYNAEGMVPNSVWNAASKLADVPKVAHRINQEVERIEREKPHDDAASRRLIREYLVGVVKDNSQSTRDRTRAAELLGKVAGVSLFSSKEEKPIGKPTSQTEFDALFQRLAAMVQSQPIEEQREDRFEAQTVEDEGVGVNPETGEEEPHPPGSPPDV